MCKGHIWLALAALSLSACSGGVDESVSGISADDNLATRTISGSFKGALDAIKSPFVDLNLTRDEIPEKLATISGSPYTLPSPLQCKVVRTELSELDTLLGADMGAAGTPTGEEEFDLVEEGADMLQSEAIGFVAGKASFIPFRGVVRNITGASKHAKLYGQAYETGKLRRAYLKGLSSALKCDKKTSVAKSKKAPAILAQKESKSL